MYNNYKNKEVKFEKLLGKTIVDIRGTVGDDQMVFTLDNGEKYQMVHYNDCCEHVTVEDIAGNLEDLLNSPILQAEESTSNENPEGVKPEHQDSFTWTFYKLATIKGYVTLRWYGESNGYYSELVTFEKITPDPS